MGEMSVQDIRPDFCACGFGTFNHLFGELTDVAVGRVENDCDDRLGPGSLCEYRSPVVGS